MKAWQWVVLGLAVVVVIILIEEESSKPVQNGYLNPTTNAIATAGVGLGGLLAGLFSGGNKVTAPSAGNVPAGTNGTWDPTGSAAAPPTTSSSDPFGIGQLAYNGQASGGTNIGGGLTTAQPSTAAGDPFGIGTLTAPTFNIGTSGADFSN
jgi:hypothetical protein